VRVLLSQLVYRNPPIPPERVIEVLHALEQEGIETVLIGGWGIDALVGRQLRTHADLDLLADEKDFESAISALENLGYRPWNQTSASGPIGELHVFSAAQTFRDTSLRVVELHAVNLRQVCSVTGSVAGREVHCLPARHQLQAQRLVGRNWFPGHRLKHRRNLAALQIALRGDLTDT
jgi:lincosamide nucleotidyltransferase A/C/D/E